MMSEPKLSAVLRQIAPQAEQVFRDQYVLEFLGGKDYENEWDKGTGTSPTPIVREYQVTHFRFLNFKSMDSE